MIDTMVKSITVSCLVLFTSMIILAFVLYTLSTLISLGGLEHGDVKRILLQQWYAKHYTFVPASHPCIEYHGRWSPSPNLTRYEASFQGSSIKLTVHNTTTVYLALANTLGRVSKNCHHAGNVEQQLILLPREIPLANSGPINILVAVNGSKEMYLHQEIYGVTMLQESLQKSETYTFEVILYANKKPSTLQFEGIWVSRGGTITTSWQSATEKSTTHVDNRISISRRQKCNKRHGRFIEIVAPMSMVFNASPQNIQRSQPYPWVSTWLQLLEQHFIDITTSVVPLDAPQCLTRHCQKTRKNEQDSPLVSRTFFRSGRPGTNLHHRPWPFSASLHAETTPVALIFVIGIADVISFLQTTSGSKHEIDAFLDEFSRTYSNFIQTIRRTAYSASSLATYQAFNAEDPERIIDESYLYNSIPSTLPIFLMLQPLPSSRIITEAENIIDLLHYGTNKVIDDLKWHIGDKKTFVVDTAGWLGDEDFQLDSLGEENYLPTNMSFTQSGHVKFAHHMSLHLCHYILKLDADGTECPFDRHDEYVGNLYLPDTENIRKVLEEKKIAAVKEMFGVA